MQFLTVVGDLNITKTHDSLKEAKKHIQNIYGDDCEIEQVDCAVYYCGQNEGRTAWRKARARSRRYALIVPLNRNGEFYFQLNGEVYSVSDEATATAVIGNRWWIEKDEQAEF